MIIVGSTALKHFNLNRCEPKDVDRWWSEKDLPAGIEDDCFLPNHIIQMVPTKDGYATPDAILTIKCSHLPWDIKWEKTKNDIIWLKEKGCQIIPSLYMALKGHWEEVHGDKSFLSLGKSKDDFFNDHVQYVYDHDYLHEVVASPAKPMYQRCLKDGHDVLIDVDKFHRMPFEDQVRMFREEVSVIAIERWLVNPHWKGKLDWWKAYQLALKKTITRLTKGWACDFMVHNLEHFILPKWEYFRNVRNLEEDFMSENYEDVFMPVLETSEFDDLDGLVVEMADGGFDPTPGVVYDLAEKEADEATGVDWKRLNWSDPVRQEKSRQHWNVRREAIEKYREQYPPTINYEHIMQEGGGEGGSEYCEGVFKLDGVYYHVSWSYYSHEGYETGGAFNTMNVVTPKEKTITVYE